MMDSSIIQHKRLKQALHIGLNHIALRPAIIYEALQAICDTFTQVCQVLNLGHMMDMEFATKEVRNKDKILLLGVHKQKKINFRYSQP